MTWRLSNDQYGASVPGASPIGVVSSLVLAPDERRKSVLFVNTGANLIYLSKRDPAILGSGIPLYPGGGFYGEPDNRGRVWLAGWYAISSAAAQNLSWTVDW